LLYYHTTNVAPIDWATVVCPVCPVLSVTFVHCDQTVARIKMKHDMQVGLGPGCIVLDGDPAPPPPKGHSPHPIFGPFLLWPNGCMHQDATWYGGRPQPRGLCVRWGHSPLNFRPMFIIVIAISLEHCTMHSRYWFVQAQVRFSILCILFLEKITVLSLFQYKYAMHSGIT